MLNSNVEPIWLRIGNLTRLSPAPLFLLVAAILMPISWFVTGELVTPISVAYELGLSNYLINSHERELRALRPYLNYDADQFETVFRSVRFHPRKIFLAAWIGGPLLVLLVNFRSETLLALLNGDAASFSAVYGLLIATLFWVFFVQIITVLFRNSILFSRLGKDHTRIDLLDTGGLTPYARVGIRNILIIIGEYVFFPLAFVSSNDYLPAMMISLLITLPTAIALLFIPMLSVRDSIKEAKRKELESVSRLMRGEREVSRDSMALKDMDNTSMIDLIMYKKMIEDVGEWPVDAPVLLRLGLYVIIPLITWIGAALVERMVDYMI